MNMRGDAQIAARGFQPYEGPRSGVAGDLPEISTAAVLAANIVWTVVGLSIVVWRYSKLVVAR